jgi:hypothetical protein
MRPALAWTAVLFGIASSSAAVAGPTVRGAPSCTTEHVVYVAEKSRDDAFAIGP